MVLALLLHFVGCFGWYRTYWSGKCTACPSKFYDHKYGCEDRGFFHCPEGHNPERACNGKCCKCEGNCCRSEEELCNYEVGDVEVSEQGEQSNPGDKWKCAEKCALENWEGMKWVHDTARCYCVNGVKGTANGNSNMASCEFYNVPAYLTKNEKKCSDDNGQVLSPSLCRYYLPRDESTFGRFVSDVEKSNKPSGCYVENGNRYWNKHSTGALPDENNYLICRGAKPIKVSEAASNTGQCPGGQQLTEFECQYEVVGFGTWHHSHDSEVATCGCYRNGKLRYFNQNKGACTSPGSGEIMICKDVVPQELCSSIVQQVESTEEGSETPDSVMYMGQNVNIGWNIVKWDPTVECVTTGQQYITGPIKCSDSTNCDVTFTITESKTNSWTTSEGGSVSWTNGMEFEAGVPLIGDIQTSVERGKEYTYEMDESEEATTEKSFSQHLACNYYEDMMINCYIFATETTFNTTATASPTFDLVMNGATEKIDCWANYAIAARIKWEAMTGNGYEAREVPVCIDTDGDVCDLATEPNCMENTYIRTNCPASCAVFGQGPAACPSDAVCEFVHIDAENGECPSPADLDKEGSTFTNCLDCFNGPSPKLCQAYTEFPDGTGPEGPWNIRNCPDNNNPPNYYNIFKYKCTAADSASSQQEKKEQDVCEETQN